MCPKCKTDGNLITLTMSLKQLEWEPAKFRVQNQAHQSCCENHEDRVQLHREHRRRRFFSTASARMWAIIAGQPNAVAPSRRKAKKRLQADAEADIALEVVPGHQLDPEIVLLLAELA
jgi:hypothetical protein